MMIVIVMMIASYTNDDDHYHLQSLLNCAAWLIKQHHCNAWPENQPWKLKYKLKTNLTHVFSVISSSRWQKISKCTWFSMVERSPTAATCAATQPPVLPNWKDTCWFTEANPAWLWDFLRYEIEKGLRVVQFTVERSLLQTVQLLQHMGWEHQDTHAHAHTLGRETLCLHTMQLLMYRSWWPQKHLLAHSGEKSFVRTQCNFSCTTACHLKIHNQIHSGEMSFSCTQCNYACTTAGNLKTHMLTHSRAKPFGCSQCNNTFTTAQNL